MNNVKQKRRERYLANKEIISAKLKEKYKNNPEYYRKRSKLFRERNPEKDTNIQLKTKYGITLEDYEIKLKEQNFKCAICPSTEYGKKDAKRFAVDHSHESGKIRGLLCVNCNTLLGKAKDNIDILKSAINYLEKYK